jgi:hypothetical protein
MAGRHLKGSLVVQGKSTPPSAGSGSDAVFSPGS